MAAITEIVSQSGQALYIVIHDSTGKIANGVSTEVYNGSNWATYVNTVAEEGATGYYKGVFPSYLLAGKYTLIIYQNPTGTPVVGDPPIGNSQIYFDGTIEEQGIGKVLVTYLLDKLAKNTAGGTPPTIGSLFDLIMNKNAGQTFSQTTDSLEAITDAGGGGPDAATIAAAVWNETMTGHVTADSAAVDLKAIYAALPLTGKISNFDQTVSTVNLGASQTGVTIGTVNALGATALASVLTQIRSALSTDTMSELSGVPSATPTIQQALMLSYMSLRNEHTATSSQEKIKNNAGTVIATGALSDDGSVYTKGQLT
jgi:hypothetical protein